MEIRTKRAYQAPEKSDGMRVLVDRVWPRGKSKEALRIHRWLQSAAPSPKLRKWFAHDSERWTEFKRRYFAELRERKAELRELLDEAGAGPLTLVYGARDVHYNNAAALREYLRRMKRGR